MSTITVGKAAPAFALPNQDGEPVRLGQFKGRNNVLLYFYPRALTPGCTVQACGVRDSAGDFAALDTVVLGVSPDPVAKLQKFRQTHALDFELLSDEDKTVCKRYGVWGKKKFMGREFMGVRRISFLIDKRGVVRGVMDKVRTKTHHQDALDWLRDHL